MKKTLVAYFGQDCTDFAVIRRVAALKDAGASVLGFTFRRKKFNSGFIPDWTDIALGETQDGNYVGRLFQIIKAAWIILRQRSRLSGTDVFYARNLDMAFLAWFAQAVSGSKAPLVYEVLDVRSAFVGSHGRARLMRWAERRILNRAKLLTVSSPGFMKGYFEPQQGYRGRWFLMENKILGSRIREQVTAPLGAAKMEIDAIRNGRWVIGFFGAIRCMKSLELLAAMSATLPVLIYLRGYPTAMDMDSFLGIVRSHPNMIYGGEYASPRDLREIYEAVDFSWGFDFYQSNGNSDWLLPNRLYDSGFYGVPILAAKETETGRRIEELSLGWTFDRPFEKNLADFLSSVPAQEVAAIKAHIASLPRSMFCEEDDTRRMLDAALSGPSLPKQISRQPNAKPGPSQIGTQESR